MDDITFCLSDCQRTDCYRHPSNIQDRTIPHSYADFREMETCPEKMQLSEEDATKDATFPVDGEPIDCISRQQAILAIERNAYRREDINETEHIILWVLDIIKWLPSVQPQRWIPVTPDSPPLYMPVLTWDGGTRHVEQRIPYIRDEIGEKIFNDWWIDGDEKWDEWAEYQPNLRDGCAIKWMPIPEPYAERRQDG